MKFLITGSIQSDRGPRRILSFTIVLLLFFLLAHSVREVAANGFFPSDIRSNLYAQEGSASRSVLMVLEDLHTDLLLISMTVLFLGSLLYQCDISPSAKKWTLNAAFFFSAAYLSSKPAAVYYSAASWLVCITFIGFHTSMLALAALSLRYMYFSGRQREDQGAGI